MRFDTKIAIIVREDLATWQKLNVTAFLAGAIAASTEDIIGEPYKDADDNTYLPMIRQPILIYAATPEALTRTHAQALTRKIPTALYIKDMFKTAHDTANRATVQAHPADSLPLVGLALYGPRNLVDKTLKGLSLHS
ncbi:hypothetical protein Ssi03_54500 [Sphaerisporangium siamense]|uniref:DUF2000 domain-containing protein n=1 Tax=Sphaerisporangium siamense TaxID=795645 RepID=A0A7W7D6G3_9ACTN|nr:DUF2000 family protein [Sphaerisporangium siamense]MBB4701173.1 hypothetical protein [Sphaerisporangium siamense]GII87460.1 hypothetical protein Ssi03_54500 [Sphaerisporangium siamense]